MLGRRLTDLVVLPGGARGGPHLRRAVEAARGLSFDVVFVPGLAEKLFPQKVSEDPILLDRARRAARARHQRRSASSKERLALRLAVGAARERIVLSYPRVDMDQSRPRVPSFYGLEVIRAAEGKLPGFDELARRAELRRRRAHRLARARAARATRSTRPSTISRSSRRSSTAPRPRRWGARTTSSAPIRTSRGRCASARGAGT